MPKNDGYTYSIYPNHDLTARELLHSIVVKAIRTDYRATPEMVEEIAKRVEAQNSLAVNGANRAPDSVVERSDLAKAGDKKRMGYFIEVDKELLADIAVAARDVGATPRPERQQHIDKNLANAAARGAEQAGENPKSSPPGKAQGDGTGQSKEPPDPYAIPAGQTLSQAASGKNPKAFDVTMLGLASAVYDNQKYGPPPEGWHAVTDQELATKLGVNRDDPSVMQWRRQYMGGEYAQEGDAAKRQHFKAEIYTDGNGNYVLSYRGTLSQGLDYNDWKNNRFQAAGLKTDGEHDKFSETAVDTAKAFVSVFGKPGPDGKPTNLAITGHSQGGGLATMGSLVTGVPAVVFDGSGLHPNTLARAGLDYDACVRAAKNGLVRSWSMKDDPVTYEQEQGLYNKKLPDALGTKIQIDLAPGAKYSMASRYAGPETGLFPGALVAADVWMATQKNLVPDTMPGAGVVKSVASAPGYLLNHSPWALRDSMQVLYPPPPKKAVDPETLPKPQPHPTPTPTPKQQVDPNTNKKDADPEGAPKPKPHPTPTPKPVSYNAPGEAPHPPGLQLDNADHPKNGVYQRMLNEMVALNKSSNVPCDQRTSQAAAALTGASVAAGFDAERVVLSTNGQNLIAMRGEPMSPAVYRTAVPIENALQQAVEVSSSQVNTFLANQKIEQQETQKVQSQDVPKPVRTLG